MFEQIRRQLARIVGGNVLVISPLERKASGCNVQISTRNRGYQLRENDLLQVLHDLPDDAGVEALCYRLEIDTSLTRRVGH